MNAKGAKIGDTSVRCTRIVVPGYSHNATAYQNRVVLRDFVTVFGTQRK